LPRLVWIADQLRKGLDGAPRTLLRADSKAGEANQAKQSAGKLREPAKRLIGAPRTLLRADSKAGEANQAKQSAGKLREPARRLGGAPRTLLRVCQ
jgi:hypothetical protein